MENESEKPLSVIDVGQRLVGHSKSAEFTANRGLVVELFPFLVDASQRMSARAISRFLLEKQNIKLSAVTITKALNDPEKSWNRFFDLIEPSARIYEKGEPVPMSVFLFKEKYLWKPIKSRLLNKFARSIVSDKVARAASVLRNKWFVIDWQIRLKARPYLAHRLGK
jgi:hypothetical protein